VLAIDRDPQAIAAGHERFADEVRLTLVHASFADLATLVPAHSHGQLCRGVLFDVGVSSPQLDDPARGFSFRADGPVDMRMDPTRGEPVSAWLARAGVDEIREVIATLGEERFARRVAYAIVEERREHPIVSTSQLAALVAKAVRTREPGKHPATRTFQALRMFINDELGQLEKGLNAAVEFLAPGGRLAVISFHSLEDRLVKRFMKRQTEVDPALRDLPVLPPGSEPRMKPVGRKSRANDAEVERNPRARSAMLRVAEKIA
jgi:16S rRNA (cytosine1402-N4)-methyltransferase